MTRDSIIDEVRALRDELAKEHGYDINAIFVALRKMETTGRGHHVTLAPRKIANVSEAAAQPDVAAASASRRR